MIILFVLNNSFLCSNMYVNNINNTRGMLYIHIIYSQTNLFNIT